MSVNFKQTWKTIPAPIRLVSVISCAFVGLGIIALGVSLALPQDARTDSTEAQSSLPSDSYSASPEPSFSPSESTITLTEEEKTQINDIATRGYKEFCLLDKEENIDVRANRIKQYTTSDNIYNDGDFYNPVALENTCEVTSLDEINPVDSSTVDVTVNSVEDVTYQDIEFLEANGEPEELSTTVGLTKTETGWRINHF